jgi:hypothetical protein
MIVAEHGKVVRRGEKNVDGKMIRGYQYLDDILHAAFFYGIAHGNIALPLVEDVRNVDLQLRYCNLAARIAQLSKETMQLTEIDECVCLIRHYVHLGRVKSLEAVQFVFSELSDMNCAQLWAHMNYDECAASSEQCSEKFERVLGVIRDLEMSRRAVEPG